MIRHGRGSTDWASWIAACAQDLLLDALASRLIASGWRCHLLDAFWLRLAKLAQQRRRQLAACASSAGAAQRLRQALRRAFDLYYEQQGSGSGSREHANKGGSEAGESCLTTSAVPAAMLQLLDAALAASTRRHRPPCSATSLSRMEAPPLDQQFQPVARRELPPLCRASDFSGLPAEVLNALDGAPGGQALEEVRGVCLGMSGTIKCM